MELFALWETATAAQATVGLLGLALGLVLLRSRPPIVRGMTAGEVERILGRPYLCSTGGERTAWVYVDRDDQRAVVTFRSGRVERVRFP